MNLKKIKWLILGTYRSPTEAAESFFKHIGYVFDTYRQKYETIFLVGDFNTEETEPGLSKFLTCYDSKSLVIDKKCFKHPENPRCIDLFITNSISSF